MLIEYLNIAASSAVGGLGGAGTWALVQGPGLGWGALWLAAPWVDRRPRYEKGSVPHRLVAGMETASAPRPAPPFRETGRKGPSQRLVEIIVAGYRPQQAAGDAWCGILGMRRFSPIGEF